MADKVITYSILESWLNNQSLQPPVETIRDAVELLKEKPKRKTGHWVEKEFSVMAGASAKCSECGEYAKGIGHDNGFSMDYTFYDYCPHCGAKMEEPTET